MLEIRDYKKGDIYKIFFANNEKYQMQYMREDVFEDQISFTAVDFIGNIVACAGLVMQWEGVYECWVAFDERYKYDHLLSLLKVMRNSLDGMIGKVVRIHAHMNSTTQNYERLMEFLGFEKEAVLVNYFPNKVDCVLFRRLY